MASVTYGKSIMSSVIMAKILWQMKLSPVNHRNSLGKNPLWNQFLQYFLYSHHRFRHLRHLSASIAPITPPSLISQFSPTFSRYMTLFSTVITRDRGSRTSVTLVSSWFLVWILLLPFIEFPAVSLLVSCFLTEITLC